VIGGKTGTAELGDGTSNSLFIGFIGDPEPRYAIAVVLEGNGGDLPSATIMARDILVATMQRRDD
jgi:cell division protein FtsI/penicillin-binding protein 2